MKKSKMEKGITLIALIITIVVLLILAAVAITAITEYNIIENANSAAQKYGDQANSENTTLGMYNTEIDKYMGGATGGNGSGEGSGEGTGSEGSGDNTGNVSGEIISKETDYTGYYADVDGDGNIDGIIYADLAVGRSGQWGNSSGAYSYEANSTLNNYTVRDATIDEQGYFKTDKTKVISPVDKEEANDRFYVMALSDVNPETVYSWYAAGYGYMNDYATTTSENFGTGKANTATMIGKWNSGAYGSKNFGMSGVDMWGVIQEEVEKGWFVPSRAEWAAFAHAFSIASGNYTEYGLSYSYWSSSQFDNGRIYFFSFTDGIVGVNHQIYGGVMCVRLGTTF